MDSDHSRDVLWEGGAGGQRASKEAPGSFG